MHNCEVIKRGRKAATLVEVMLGIGLSIIVVFVALGLWGDNLQDMISASNFKNMFLNKDKTTYSSYNRDYTQVTVPNYNPTEVPIQITGEQGLQKCLDDATKKIDEYIKNPPKNEAEVMDLAKWATIKKIIRTTDTDGLQVQSLTSAEESFAYSYGINIQLIVSSNVFQTIVSPTNNNYTASTKTLDFSIGTRNSNVNRDLTETQTQIDAVNQVLKNFK